MIKAVLFDLDGTLIDTEKYYRVCWPKALKAFGYDMSDEQALTFRSLGRPFVLEHIKNMFGEDIDYYKVREKRKELMAEMIAECGIQLKPGAVACLESLRSAGIKTGIATATDLERTEKYLKQVGLSNLFDRVICATMVENGKPAPDIYKYACEQIGEKPEECIAVEDSPNGVLSAYRAGCRVVMVPDQTQPDDELREKLYACINDLTKLMNIVTSVPDR